MKKPVRIGGKVIDWRDSSSFDVVVTSGSSVVLYVRAETLPTTLSIDWGDDKYNNYVLNSHPSFPSVFYSYAHPYASSGVFKIKIKTSANLAGLSCSNCSRYNAGYTKQFNRLSYVIVDRGTSTQNLNDFLGVLKYMLITNSPIKLDLSKLLFSPEIQVISISGNLPNIYGVVRFSDILPNLQALTLYGNNSANQGFYSLLEMIIHTPYCRFYDIEAYSGLSQIAINSDLTEIAKEIATHESIDGFILLSINKGIYGDGSALFKNLFERPENSRIYITGAPLFTTELGVQTSEFYSHVAKTLYLNNVTGDVSKFEWRYNAATYIRVDPISTAFGSLNKIENVRQLGNSQLVSLMFYLQNAKNVTLNIASVRHLRFNSIVLYGGDNISGDISTLVDNCQYCLTYSLTSITSNAITGWREYLTGIYGKRLQYPTSPKTFNCPNVMKAMLTGIYQQTAGFVKGAADGNPTSDREMIYVLVNNYNWTFTNI